MKFDSLIFDMDGTLWDAVDTYALIWNTVYERMGLDITVTRRQLIDCMGLPLDKILDRLAPEGLDKERFMTLLREADTEIMPRHGGRLYPGVAELLPQLAEHYKLYMVSNCGPHGLDYFLDYTGLRPWISDTLAYGQNLLSKADNIALMCRRHNLKRPIYIGDTDGDCQSAHAAGVPMMHVTYGFGRCDNAEYQVNSFPALATFFLSNTQQS